MRPYETAAMLSQYLLFHYGDPMAASPPTDPPTDSLDFHGRCAALAAESTPVELRGRALDLGCGVGRATFELCRYCTETVGIDASKKFIDACKALRRDGQFPYRYPVEGEISQAAIAQVPKEIARDRAHFECGDACALRPGIGKFGIVLMANLIDRVGNPAACLDAIAPFIQPCGTLVVTTPCTWLPDFTPKDNWLGGRVVRGQPQPTEKAIALALKENFTLVARRDMPFLIREHARKFQWLIALATVWRKEDHHGRK